MLRRLAAYQAREFDPLADAEPRSGRSGAPLKGVLQLALAADQGGAHRGSAGKWGEKLLGAFIATFLLAVGVAALSLIPDASRAGV